ncbi:MAG: hypothetical protein J3K34DRAFT_525831 [Monoraphidium minutum]|nr:MAG: hypothetical protein J3K34DRAFT_525831 [Monoraphidium minutum]
MQPQQGYPGGGYQQNYQQPAPVAGYAITPPAAPPRPGEVVIGWEILPVDEGCSCDLNVPGIVLLVVLILVFWPIFWIPMVIPAFKNQRQRPVYGPPGSTPHPQVAVPIPTAAPAAGQPVTGYPAPAPAHAHAEAQPQYPHPGPSATPPPAKQV